MPVSRLDADTESATREGRLPAMVTAPQNKPASDHVIVVGKPLPLSAKIGSAGS